MSNEKNIKAFNYGYELAKIDHNLANKLTASFQAPKNESLSYFNEGVKQHLFEKMITITKDQNQDQDHTKDIDDDFDMDF